MVGFIKDTSKIKMILHRKSFNNFNTLWLPHISSIKVLKIFSAGRFLQNACDHVFLSNSPSLLLEVALPFSPRSAAVCCQCCRVSIGTPTEKYSWTSPTAANLETILTLAKLLWFLFSVAKQLSNFRDYIIVLKRCTCRPFTKCVPPVPNLEREIKMGRTVVLEDRLRAEFEQLVGTRQPHVGLLIGQVNQTHRI